MLIILTIPSYIINVLNISLNNLFNRWDYDYKVFIWGDILIKFNLTNIIKNIL